MSLKDSKIMYEDIKQDVNQFKSPYDYPINNNLLNNNFNETNSIFNVNIFRNPSKSVMIKSTQSMKIENNVIGLLRRDSNVDMDDVKSTQKPSITSLPFITRSNSFFNKHSENNQNLLNIGNNDNGNNINLVLASPTPRSKKDEIKKWLSRI